MSILSTVAVVLFAAATGLSGRVIDEDGAPVSGAIVAVSTAGPKVGPATTCPSCYRDCAKRTITDANGRFAFENLSSQLRFSLAAGAPGYQGTTTERYDPVETPDVEITLTSLPRNKESDRVRGRVVDLDNRPIGGAEIRPQLIRRGNLWGGSDDSVTSLTLTDEQGEFELTVGDHITSVDLRVTAQGFAPDDLPWARTNDGPLQIRLGRGASLSGKLVFEGQPVSFVELGLVQKNRIMGNIVTPQDVSTDGDGVFRFENLPPDIEYTLYTNLGQNAPAVLPVTLVEAPGHGELADFGSIETTGPSRFTLTVRTEDGTALPKDSYVILSRRDAWRSTREMLETKPIAVVHFRDVPEETVQFQIGVRGYTVVKTNPAMNLDRNRRYSLSVDGTTEVEVIVRADEPGKAPVLPPRNL